MTFLDAGTIDRQTLFGTAIIKEIHFVITLQRHGLAGVGFNQYVKTTK
jgi:hypothetical protein